MQQILKKKLKERRKKKRRERKAKEIRQQVPVIFYRRDFCASDTIRLIVLACAEKGKRLPLEAARQHDAAASAMDDAAGAAAAADASVLDVVESGSSTPGKESPRPETGKEVSETGISTDTDREDEDKGEDVRAASTGLAASSGVKGKDAGGKEARKRKGRSDTEGDEPEPASKRPAKKQRRKAKAVVVEDSDDSEGAKKSRYLPVSASSLFNAWANEILDPIRKEFQLALLVRDGFPAKVSSLDRAKNLKQLLASAKNVLEKPLYAKFKAQVDAAYQDPSKE